MISQTQATPHTLTTFGANPILDSDPKPCEPSLSFSLSVFARKSVNSFPRKENTFFRINVDMDVSYDKEIYDWGKLRACSLL